MQNVINTTSSSKYRWLSGITGALAVILGIVGLLNPLSSLVTISWVFGLLLILGGATTIGAWFDLKDSTDRSAGLMFNGILGIILGGIMLFTYGSGLIMMAILFSVWFIVDSCTSFSYSNLSNHPVWFKFASVIGVIVGVILLFSPVLSLGVLFLTVSFALIIYGIMAIVKAI